MNQFLQTALSQVLSSGHQLLKLLLMLCYVNISDNNTVDHLNYIGEAKIVIFNKKIINSPALPRLRIFAHFDVMQIWQPVCEAAVVGY